MKLRFYCALGLTWLCLTACGGEATVDATDEDSIKASVKAVKETLPKERHKQFDQAIMTIIMGENPLRNMLTMTKEDMSPVKIYKKIEGKTAEEIIALAQDIRSASRKIDAEREIPHLKIEIAELKKAIDLHKKSSVLVSKISISKITVEEIDPRVESGIQATYLVTNGSSQPLSALVCRAVYRTPGRSIPWSEMDSYVNISGGVEPGETVKVTDYIRRLGSLSGYMQYKEGAVLSLSIKEVFGLNNKKIAALIDIDKKIKELESLESRLAELGG